MSLLENQRLQRYLEHLHRLDLRQQQLRLPVVQVQQIRQLHLPIDLHQQVHQLHHLHREINRKHVGVVQELEERLYNVPLAEEAELLLHPQGAASLVEAQEE